MKTETGYEGITEDGTRVWAFGDLENPSLLPMPIQDERLADRYNELADSIDLLYAKWAGGGCGELSKADRRIALRCFKERGRMLRAAMEAA